MLDLYRAKVEFLELQMQHRERRNLDDDERPHQGTARPRAGADRHRQNGGPLADTVETYLRRVRLGAEGSSWMPSAT